MKVTVKKLSELRHPDKNVRMHTDTQQKEFIRSIEMFGQVRPIVCDDTGLILCGNGLFDALTAMGRVEADCYVVSNLTEAEKKKLMLADNRIYSLGVDDMDVFDALILELKDDLNIPGYDEDILNSLVIDVSAVDDLMSGYGVIPEEKIEEIRQTGERYEADEETAAANAKEYIPDVPAMTQEVRELTGVSAPFKAEETERQFIICPKCGERIWL